MACAHACPCQVSPGAPVPPRHPRRGPPGAAVLLCLLRLPHRAGPGRRPPGRDRRVRQRAAPHRHRARPAPLRRAEPPGLDGLQAGDLGLRELDVHQRADLGDRRRARLPLPLPQPVLLLGAEHVHGGDGPGPDRVHGVPDGAAAVLPRVGVHRRGVALHRRQPRQRVRQRALQPLRRRALDARRVRADDRHPDLAPGQAPRHPRVLGLLPAAGDVRDRRHRQPLPRRRLPRRGDRRHRRIRRDLAGARPAPGVGLRAEGGRARLMSTPTAQRSRSEERREVVRNRLIESRLTPNAISLTGLVLNVLAAVLVWERYFFLGGVAFIVGSIMDTLDGRYSRMSGKGTQFGAFLDSSLDRIEEAIVLTAVAGYFASRGMEAATMATAVAIGASLLVSYTRARAEALGVECKVGIATRAVRVVILSAGLVFAKGASLGDFELLAPAVYVLAALSVITTLQRILHVRSALRAV